jgi:hypothetical protein
MAIAIDPCNDDICAPAQNQMGTVLSTKNYNPILHEQHEAPYENFTVTIPDSDYFKGSCAIKVARLHLIGVCGQAIS